MLGNKAAPAKSSGGTTLVSRDTVIEASEGTTMEIPANAFVIKGTEELAKNVNLQLSEYYSTSDILLANLSTTSNGHMLETAGMLHITARSCYMSCLIFCTQ